MYRGRVRTAAPLVSVLLLLTSCSDAADPIDGSVDASAPRDARVIRLPDTGPRPDGATPGTLGPPYPIVLAHGFFGFDDFAGAGFLTYFYGVVDALDADGEALVFTPTVDPFNDSETRGAQLLAHVERIVAETGHAKVNLIGHSQGGLDARYVAATRPDLVASVTTYATPNRGTPIADIVVGLVEDERLRGLVDQLVQIIGAPIWDAAGEESSVFRALEQFSQPGMADFNARFPNAPGVAYYSLTGRTDRDDGVPDCDATDSPPFVSRWMRTVDPVDPLLDIAEQIVDGGDADIVNDGLVRVRDARWGRFLGCVPADHLDEVGQILGDGPGFGNAFDHRELFVALVAFLRDEGH